MSWNGGVRELVEDNARLRDELEASRASDATGVQAIQRLRAEVEALRGDAEEVAAARKWINDKTGVGGGLRPLSFLISSHEYMAHERKEAQTALATARLAVDEHFGPGAFARATSEQPARRAPFGAP